MFKKSFDIDKAIIIAREFIDKNYNNNCYEEEPYTEDDGVFWIIIFKSKDKNCGNLEFIIKKKNLRIIKCINSFNILK